MGVRNVDPNDTPYMDDRMIEEMIGGEQQHGGLPRHFSPTTSHLLGPGSIHSVGFVVHHDLIPTVEAEAEDSIITLFRFGICLNCAFLILCLGVSEKDPNNRCLDSLETIIINPLKCKKAHDQVDKRFKSVVGRGSDDFVQSLLGYAVVLNIVFSIRSVIGVNLKHLD